MNIPNTYTEWINCFEYIKNHPRNDMYIDTLNQGTLDYDEGLINKLSNELLGVILNRLTEALNNFSNSLKEAVEYNAFSLEIIGLRKEFNYAYRLGNIKIFPEDVKRNIISFVINKANSVQKSLEEKTRLVDRSGMVNSMIKNNPINVFK